jgi:ubiquinone/menaquinone biosynthesis C-methylase UbiE
MTVPQHDLDRTAADQEAVYERGAEAYEALVAAEDCDGRLVPALASIAPLDGATVLEVGVGTGRIARAVIGRVARLVGIDRARAMLAVARRSLQAVPGAAPWALHLADARDLPFAPGWADVAIAGWVFGHLRCWMPEDWRGQVGRAIAEMRRALRPAGVLVLIETLGTGTEHPDPPAGLEDYLAYLEHDQGLERREIRTDYRFPDVGTAAAVTGAFFGAAFADRVRAEGWTRVPEWTGIWWG